MRSTRSLRSRNTALVRRNSPRSSRPVKQPRGLQWVEAVVGEREVLVG